MARALSALLALLPSLGAAGCLRDYGDAPFTCASSPACPEGYRCIEEVCQRASASSASDGAVAPRDAVRREAPATQEGGALPASPDQGSAPAQLPDLGAPGKSCPQIMDCCDACSTSACCTSCFNAGSPAGKAAFDAVEDCFDYADYHQCDAKCYADPYSKLCRDCVVAACQSQLQACQSS